MPSTTDVSKVNLLDISFLLIGEPGTGKTHFLGTLPKPLYVFDVDKGMRTLFGVEGITYDTFRDAPYGMAAAPGLYKWGAGWSAMRKKAEELTRDCPYAAVAIDTVSFAWELAKNYARAKNPAKQGPEAMELPQWGDAAGQMKAFLDVFLAIPAIKVATCHVKRDINPVTETVEFLPLLEGQMQGKIGGFFDECYYTNIKKEGSGDKATYRYCVQTAQANLFKSARTRIGVPDGTNSNWPDVLKAIGGGVGDRPANAATSGTPTVAVVNAAVKPASKYAAKK
jgi:hypothetical protein